MSKFTLVEQVSDPSAPAAGKVALYAKTDGGVYARFDIGAPAALAGGAAAPGVQTISAPGGSAGLAVTFSNTMGLSFGMNGSTISASLPSVQWYENQGGAPAFVNSAAQNSGAANVSFQRFSVPYQLEATRLDYIGHLSVNGSQAYSSTMRVALYTMSGSTAGVVATASGTDGAAAGQYTNHSGTRMRSVGLGTWALTPGEYALGMVHSINGPAGTTGSVSIFGESNIAMLANPGGAAVTDYFAEGILLAASSAPPPTIQLSEVNGSHAAAGAMPYFRLVGTF